MVRSRDSGVSNHAATSFEARYALLRMRGYDSVRYAEAGCVALASIWPMASTTASKVSMVEAWRAL